MFISKENASSNGVVPYPLNYCSFLMIIGGQLSNWMIERWCVQVKPTIEPSRPFTQPNLIDWSGEKKKWRKSASLSAAVCHRKRQAVCTYRVPQGQEKQHPCHTFWTTSRYSHKFGGFFMFMFRQREGSNASLANQQWLHNHQLQNCIVWS